ncbi:MAG TPA: M48 family metallopeptidase [Caldimonas sp.]|jgi:STE24 endopeptidase|nr:M48 family metallopeptidase [Caldimonas sp.]HEX4235386.1 M48 family metallopeptidase [Caldimonas sp.]
MSSLAWTSLFAAALVVSLVVRTWLFLRQMRHVTLHRDQVPPAFRVSVPLAAHQRAADYTLAKARLAHRQVFAGTVILLAWTLFGGLDALNVVVREAVAPRFGALAYEVALVAAFVAIGAVLELPFDWYATFRLEQRFGFNRVTWRLWLADMFKGIALAAIIGIPLLAAVLWIMAAAGRAWWLWAWAAWMTIVVAAQVVVPSVIAPLFNRFEELKDQTLRARVEALMARAGFAARGLFVMDGSRRSAHANAYFTGFGSAKRVVFYDTLLARLAAGEVEAVLAHELGHFKLRHIRKRMLAMAALTLAFFAMLGWLATRSWFYSGLAVAPNLTLPNDALALILLLLAGSVFGVFASPLLAGWSRRDEFEADAFASRHADSAALASALLKLHEDNASTLTPDPIYARFYYSHPPAVERLAALAPRAAAAIAP